MAVLLVPFATSARSAELPGVYRGFLAFEATAQERAELLGSGRSFTFAPLTELDAFYRERGVAGDRKIVTYCGRGYAGACGLLALKLLKFADVRLYDGSWAEWSADPALPVETEVADGS